MQCDDLYPKITLAYICICKFYHSIHIRMRYRANKGHIYKKATGLINETYLADLETIKNFS